MMARKKTRKKSVADQILKLMKYTEVVIEYFRYRGQILLPNGTEKYITPSDHIGP
jgi:hypothetical protein